MQKAHHANYMQMKEKYMVLIYEASVICQKSLAALCVMFYAPVTVC